MRFIFLLLAISTLAHSQDFSDIGLKEVGESEAGRNRVLSLEDANNKTIEIVYSNELTPKDVNLIKRIYTTLISWEELTLKKAEIIFDSDSVDIIILPESLIYNEVEISQYMPSGMQFYYTKFFEYDFRMFKDTLFMRLKGQYYSKDEFFQEVYNAVEDPILYIQIHDPSYLIRQIDALRSVNNDQSKEIFELKEELSSLLAKHESLYSANEMLLDEFKRLRSGTIAINNKNFFGSLGAYNQADVEKVIEIKEGNLKLTVKEVSTKLKDKGLKVSNKTIEAVFMIYFGEFPQNK